MRLCCRLNECVDDENEEKMKGILEVIIENDRMGTDNLPYCGI